MSENLIEVSKNDKGHVSVVSVGADKVKVIVAVAKESIEKLAQFFRTDRPEDWTRTENGFSKVCGMNGAADSLINHAEYALQRCGDKPRRRSRWRSWRSQLKKST